MACDEGALCPRGSNEARSVIKVRAVGSASAAV